MAASVLQLPHPQLHFLPTKSHLLQWKPFSVKLNVYQRDSAIRCSSGNGREPDSMNGSVGKKAAEEKRRAELSAKIASGAFTVENSGVPSFIRDGLSKLGIQSEFLESLFRWNAGREQFPKIPEAKGSISAIRSEAFFIPLYELFITYGGIFRLTFGPKV